MQRPTFTATALVNGRRNPDHGSVELNLIDAKGNTQNLVLADSSAGHVLGAILLKRMPDPSTDFYLNESIPLAGLAPFKLDTGQGGLRMFVSKTEAIDFVFPANDILMIKQAVDFLAGMLAPVAASPAP
jgi:hypothetical protein